MALDGVSFSEKFVAYENYLKGAKKRMGLTPEQTREQFARYSEGLQYDQIKADNKAVGHELAREISIGSNRRELARERADRISAWRNFTDAEFEEAAQKVGKTTSQALVPVGSQTVQKTQTSEPVLYSPDAKKIRKEQKRLYNQQKKLLPEGKEAQVCDVVAEPTLSADARKIKVAVDKTLHGKSNATTAAAIDRRLGLGVQNHELELLNRNLYGRELGSARKARVEKALHARTGATTASAIDRRLGVCRKSGNKTLQNMGDYYKALEKSGRKGKGKAALIGLIAAAVGFGLGALVEHIRGKKVDEVVAEQDDNTAIVQPSEEETPEVIAPTEPSDETEETPEVMTPVESTEASEQYDFETINAKWGDNYWNYAKYELINENIDKAGYKPSNKEILNRMYEIMERNGVKMSADGVHPDPMLLVGDEVKLKKFEPITA